MNRSVSVARGVAQRHVRKLRKAPPLALPPLLIPLFFFAAFTGALSGIGETPDFAYYDYTAFEFVFVAMMAALFVGVFTSFELAGDYETGLGNRMMLAAPKRMAIVVGYLVPGLARALLTVLVILLVALVAGMDVKGGVLDVIALLGLALLLNVAATLFGAGIALRIQSAQASPLILLPVFLVLFLTPVYSERENLAGWLKTAANVNPLTPALEAGRGFLAGEPESTALAFGCALGLIAVFAIFAVTGMRKAERELAA